MSFKYYVYIFFRNNENVMIVYMCKYFWEYFIILGKLKLEGGRCLVFSGIFLFIFF